MCRAFAFSLFSAFVAIASASCGRSIEPRVACPPASGDCATLDAASATLAQTHAQATGTGDAQAAAEAGQCLASLVEQRLDQSCVASCDVLCALHPCNVRDGDTVLAADACVARCTSLLGDGTLTDDVVRTAAVRAAEDPALCTCQPCVVAPTLCPTLFDCAAP